MRIVFDRGTVLVAESPPVPELATVPGLLWDPRIGRYRAAGYRHAEVRAALVTRGYEVIDEVARLEDAPVFKRPLELRPYQEEALRTWERRGRRGVVVLPTGSGKTRLAIAAIAGSAMASLCLVPTRVLLEQWVRELSERVAGPIGRLGDGDHVIAPVTVATYESAYRRMELIGNRFALLVVDEAHHFGAGMRDEALEMAIAPARLGVTATPVADAEARVASARLLGPVIYELHIGDLAGTFLATFDVITLHVQLRADEEARYVRWRATFREALALFRRTSPNGTWREFTLAASRTTQGRAALHAWQRTRRLVAWCEEKRALIGELLARHRAARVLVFVADNAAAYAIAREHLVMPLTCDIGRAERAAALAAFAAGTLRVLVSARVLNEGLDVPAADVAIIVGGTQGEREHVQRIGRLLRPAPGKRATVYELVVRDTHEVAQAARRRQGLAGRTAAPVQALG